MYQITLILLKDLLSTSLQLCLPKNLRLPALCRSFVFLSGNMNNFIYRIVHEKICNKKFRSCQVNKKCLNVSKCLLRFNCLYTILTPSAFNVDFEQVFSYKALLSTYNTCIPETYLEPSRQSTIDLFLQK